jgi:sulfite reductase alpha subunit-like flavoprotein
VNLGRCAVAATLAFALAACGETDAPEAPASEQSPSSAATPVGLREICPRVEADLPGLKASGEAWRDFNASLGAVFETADLEAQNALRLLAPGTKAMQRLAEKGGIPVGAEMTLNDSLQDFGARCRTAGSSAFS